MQQARSAQVAKKNHFIKRLLQYSSVISCFRKYRFMLGGVLSSSSFFFLLPSLTIVNNAKFQIINIKKWKTSLVLLDSNNQNNPATALSGACTGFRWFERLRGCESKRCLYFSSPPKQLVERAGWARMIFVAVADCNCQWPCNCSPTAVVWHPPFPIADEWAMRIHWAGWSLGSATAWAHHLG